jgi:hypothetical protein
MQAVKKFRRTGAAFFGGDVHLCLIVGYQGAAPGALAKQENQATLAPRKDYAAAVEMLAQRYAAFLSPDC